MTPTPSSEPVLTQTSSEGSSKPLLLAAAVFLAVMGGSFVYMRTSTPEPGARRSHSDNSGQDDSPGKAVTAKGKLPEGASQADRLLENVGSVSSIHLYQSYLNIGLLADAARNETYTKEEAASTLSTVATLLQTVDAQMQKLENVGLDSEEVEAVRQVRKVSGMLQTQAGHLQTYWNTGGKSSLDQFQQVRRQSWTELRGILGLGDQRLAKQD